MDFKILYDLIRALLFGNKKFKLKISNDLLINQLYLDIQRVIDIEEIVEQGGLLKNQTIILQDLDNLINYIERGNKHFLDNCSFKNEFQLELKTCIIRNFYYNLSRVCRGKIDNGILSNNVQKDRIPLPSKSDEETLEHILNNDNSDYLIFKNAEFWGNVAKKLINEERPYVLTEIQLPIQYLRDIQRLYDIKCKSLGNIINPYSLILSKYDFFIDSIHWQSVESFRLYLEHFPESSLSKTCLEFINLIITAIMTADDDLLPKNILNDEIQLRRFIKNIESVHNRIQKVHSSNIPLKTIDVFHRLLALNKYDYMWDILYLEKTRNSNTSNILINMYLKNIELEKENKSLREELINIENKFHANV